MKLTEAEAEIRFQEVVDQARGGEPIEITRQGETVAVVLDADAYERLRGIEDHYWGERAELAAARGHLTPADSMALLARGLARANEEDEGGTRRPRE